MRNIKQKIRDYFKGRVVFEDGSYVEWLDREEIIYVEGQRSMEITLYYQPGFFSSARVLPLAENFRWNPPHDAENVTEDERSKILRKLTAYCNKNRIKLSLE